MNTALVLTRPDDIFGTHRVRAGAPRALLLGAAAGFCFALQAALTKQLVGEFGGGAGAVVAHLWAGRDGVDRIRSVATGAYDGRARASHDFEQCPLPS